MAGILFAGCQEGTAPQQQPAGKSQTKQAAAKQDAAVPPAEVKQEEKKTDTAEGGIKNPFKPFLVKPSERPAVVVPRTPLQRYEVEQLKLVAIVWGHNSPIVMVEAPDGKGYSIKKGDLIGNRDGRVKRIDVDKQIVVVEERFRQVTGDIGTSEFTLKLPVPKGEEELR